MVDTYSVAILEHFGIPLPPIVTQEQATWTLAAALRNGKIAPQALTKLQAEVTARVHELEWAIIDGRLPGRMLVQDRPLADWLDLEDLARVLRRSRG
jgi:hypothetical protein